MRVRRRGKRKGVSPGGRNTGEIKSGKKKGALSREAFQPILSIRGRVGRDDKKKYTRPTTFEWTTLVTPICANCPDVGGPKKTGRGVQRKEYKCSEKERGISILKISKRVREKSLYAKNQRTGYKDNTGSVRAINHRSCGKVKRNNVEKRTSRVQVGDCFTGRT